MHKTTQNAAVLQLEQPCGIPNPGILCHAIVVVQLLRQTLAPHLVELKNFLEPHRLGPRPCHFTRALVTLLESQGAQPVAANFARFITAFRNHPQHQDYLNEQQDASETLTQIISRLHEDLHHDGGWVNFSTSLLLGRFGRHLTCDLCPPEAQLQLRHAVDRRFPNPTTDRHSISLSAALLHHSTTVPMLIDGQLANDLPFGNDAHCDAVHGGQAAITTAYALLPPAASLLVHVDRCGDGHVYNRTEIAPTDTISLNIDGVDQQQQYRLSAIIVHVGATINSGHYVFFSRSSVQDRWFYANDARVHVIQPNSPTHGLNYNGTYAQLWSRQSHLLLYKRIN